MNKNGFVLAEAIVVSIFVIGMIAYIAVNMLPIISKYEKVSNYDDLQEIYLINDLYDELKIRNVTPENGIYKFSMNSNTVSCIRYTSTGSSEDGAFCTETGFRNFIYKYLNMSQIVVGNVASSDRSKLSRSMREYYNYYVSNNKNDDNTELADNEMLVEFQDNTFASVVLK